MYDLRHTYCSVSSHAPARGASLPSASPRPPLSFKSCPREGGISNGCRHRLPDRVSSHAPARGASIALVRGSTALLFQVMPPRGGASIRVGATFR